MYLCDIDSSFSSAWVTCGFFEYANQKPALQTIGQVFLLFYTQLVFHRLQKLEKTFDRHKNIFLPKTL